MADTITTKYKFVLPEVGGSDDTWGTKLNDNFNKLDGFLSSVFTDGSETSIGYYSGDLGGNKVKAGLNFLDNAGINFLDINSIQRRALFANAGTVTFGNVEFTEQRFNGPLTFWNGARFGNFVAADGPLDLSRHISLFGNNYGFSISGAALNLVSGGTSIDEYIGGSLKLHLDASNLISAVGVNANAGGLPFDVSQDRSAALLHPSGLCYLQGVAAAGPSATVYGVWHGTTNTMQIRRSGAILNVTGTIGVLSDPAEKRNIASATPKLNDLMELNVINYNLINSPRMGKLLGFDADNVEQVFPSMVDRSTDETGQPIGPRYVKWSVMVPVLVKALQELTLRVKQLEGAT